MVLPEPSRFESSSAAHTVVPPEPPTSRPSSRASRRATWNESLADFIGSLQDRDLLDRVFKNPDALHEDVVAAMQPPLAAVDASQTLDEVFATLTGRTNAVVVATGGKPVGVLTRSDLLEYLAHQRQTS